MPENSHSSNRSFYPHPGHFLVIIQNGTRSRRCFLSHNAQPSKKKTKIFTHSKVLPALEPMKSWEKIKGKAAVAEMPWSSWYSIFPNHWESLLDQGCPITPVCLLKNTSKLCLLDINSLPPELIRDKTLVRRLGKILSNIIDIAWHNYSLQLTGLSYGESSLAACKNHFPVSC